MSNINAEFFESSEHDFVLLKFRNELWKEWIDVKEVIDKLRFSFFKEICRFIFKNYLDIINFSWMQYTAFDSDNFHAYTGHNEIFINGKQINENTQEHHIQALSDISLLLDIFNDNIFIDMFGNHSKITVSNDCQYKIEKYLDHE